MNNMALLRPAASGAPKPPALPASDLILRFIFMAAMAAILFPYTALAIDLVSLRETWKHPHVIALVHVGVLGWLTTLLIGVTYPLLPFLCGTGAAAPRRAGVVLAHLAVGVPLLIIGMAAWITGFITLGGIIVTGAVAGYLVRVLPVLSTGSTGGVGGAPRTVGGGSNVMGAFRAGVSPYASYLRHGACYLAATVAAGLFLALNTAFGFTGNVLLWLPLHLAFGVVGWGMMAVTAVGCTLAEMTFDAGPGRAADARRWTPAAGRYPVIGRSLRGAKPLAPFARFNLLFLHVMVAAITVRTGLTAFAPDSPTLPADLVLIAAAAVVVIGFGFDALRLRFYEAVLAAAWLATAVIAIAATLLQPAASDGGVTAPWVALGWLLTTGWFGTMLWAVKMKAAPVLICRHAGISGDPGQAGQPSKPAGRSCSGCISFGTTIYQLGVLPSSWGLWSGNTLAFHTGAGLLLLGSTVLGLTLWRLFRNAAQGIVSPFPEHHRMG